MMNETTLRFYVTENGTLGEAYHAPEAVPEAKQTAPGAALADLLGAADDDEDWNDAPDVSADFAAIADPSAARVEHTEPLTADFASNPDGSLTLLRWPRLARPAVIPSTVCGRTVKAIAATAFASVHLPDDCFDQMFTSPISFSVFCMRMGRQMTSETVDEGGPTEIHLPDTVRSVGPYAFWRCTRLREIDLPDAIVAMPVGCFGECCALESIHLPASLATIGWLAKRTDLPRLYFSCGTADKLMYENFCKFRTYAQQVGLPAQFYEKEGYGHEWRYWELCIQEVLETFFPRTSRAGNAF